MAEPRPLLELTKWRIREFLREPEAIFWVFAFPLILALALGIAFRNRGPQPVRIAVEDTTGAEAMAQALQAADHLEATVESRADADRALRTGGVDLIVVPGEPVIFRYDSTRQESFMARMVTDDALQRASGREDVREIREIRRADPGGRYIDFLLPGLLGMNIMGTGIWGVGFGIAHARSRKLLKRFVASPMRKGHYLLGQMLARLVFLVLEVGVLVLFGYFAFGVPFRGSLFSFAVLVLAGALAFAGLGVLVASRTKTIEGVSGLMNLVMMPMWILSGVFFSASHFPDVMQPLVRALPLTALNDGLRAIMLDGVGFTATFGWLAVIGAWGVGCFWIALKIFRWS